MTAGETYFKLTGFYQSEKERTTEIIDTWEQARLNSAFYQEYTLQAVIEKPSEDSGGSSYLCSCSGVDTGRHSDWCGYLNLFHPVTG